jgi:N-acetylneuraminate synthase/N,N'-diacetyllegionaminate synthase
MMNIGGRRIGGDNPTFVIAEIGVNHDGNVETARALVKTAAACGADAVKFQVFSAEQLLSESAEFAAYQKANACASSPRTMLARYELGRHELKTLAVEAGELGLGVLATPFSISDVEVLRSIKIDAVKIASPDLVHRELIAEAAGLGLSMILSSGCATVDEIQAAVDDLRRRRVRFALLHCVSSYPTDPQDAHLGWISEISRRFSVTVGYSDHTDQVMAGALAVAAGARLIEKHLTHDRDAVGPDHKASADPAMFAEYVRLIRLADKMKGTPGKRPLPCESDVRRLSRQSIVARRALPAGHVVARTDLEARRPGTGIPAAQISSIVGRRTTRAVSAGALLSWDMLDHAA